MPLFALIARILLGLGATILASFGVYQILPEKIKVAVPFISQAPGGIWTEPWQNACEEASIAMINAFYSDSASALTAEEEREEILKIFDTKEKRFGPSSDESMKTIATIISDSELNWDAYVVDDPTIDQMKAELANQRPIIAPIYARALDNPYYVGEGPDYHVVVIVGYDDVTGEFITHDPGTARGEDFRYPYQEFYDAINDFLTTKDYTAGPTRVLFTQPAL